MVPKLDTLCATSLSGSSTNKIQGFEAGGNQKEAKYFIHLLWI